jgi:hypothetical protein
MEMAVREPIPELLEFLSVYDDKIVKLALAVRRSVLTESPDATETIYDAYNAVAVGYSFTGRLKESFCHVAVYPKHVNWDSIVVRNSPIREGSWKGRGDRFGTSQSARLVN